MAEHQLAVMLPSGLPRPCGEAAGRWAQGPRQGRGSSAHLKAEKELCWYRQPVGPGERGVPPIQSGV